MALIAELTERKERPAYVRFETVAEEDKAASIAQGHYVAKDVDYALITPPYSKDVFKIKIAQWKQNMEQDVNNGRLPDAWRDQYLKAYEKWKAGQEVPLNGIPIKGWGVISPAQQQTLIAMSVLTVEDLAQINDEGLRRIGMGSVELKAKAKAWLSQLHDKGPLTQENAALKAKVSILEKTVEDMQARLAEMQERMGRKDEPATASISADDIIDEDEDPAKRYEKKFGKPPHHRMKPETILKALEE